MYRPLLAALVAVILLQSTVGTTIKRDAPRECKTTAKGAEYMGTLAVTRRGWTCQSWTLDTPQKNNYNDEGDLQKFPDESFEAAANHCRNPGGDDNLPWCYINDNTTTERWDYCDVCDCDKPAVKGCYDHPKGYDYTGTVSVTASGVQCQRWDSQSPHDHRFFPDNQCAKDAENYCRNFASGGENRPWCYTTNPDNRWEVCDICPCSKWNDNACTDTPCSSGSSSCKPKCGGQTVCTCKPGNYGRECQHCGQVKSKEGKSCVFPFIYKGVLQHECTLWDAQEAWCSYTDNYDDDKQWGTCNSMVTAGCPDKTVTPSTGDWSSQILKDVATVPSLGRLASLAVWGEHSQPVLTRDFNPQQMLIAAAEFQGAKVVVFTGDQYTQKFVANDASISTLSANIKTWLVGSSTAVVKDVSSESSFSVSDNTKIAVWDASEKSAEFVSALKAWLGSGKGLVVSVSPSAVNAANPVNGLLLEMGMGIFDKTWEKSGDIDVKNNRARKAHLGKLIEDTLRYEAHIVYNYILITAYTKNLPDNILLALKPKFDNLFSTTRVHYIPTGANNVRDGGMYLALLYDAVIIQKGLVEKAPALDAFPGDFSAPPPLVQAALEISSYRYDWFATGYYLPAGQEAKITITGRSGPKPNSWKLHVNVHDDTLYKKTYLERWPKIYNDWDLEDKTELTFKSPFGGLIVLKSPEGDGTNTIKFTLENVVETPRYDIMDPNSKGQWATRRNAPGLWAVFDGEFISIVLQSHVIRTLEDPEYMIKQWDDVMKAMYHVTGDNIRTYRREWFVPDEQISAGYGHAGYPIMLEWSIDDVISTPAYTHWGLNHEIGHNIQEGAWTLKGQIDVSNNMLVTYIQERFGDIDPWVGGLNKGNFMSNSKIETCKKTLSDLGTTFSYDTYNKDVWGALFVYEEIVHHLGWPHIMKVLRAYNSLPYLKTDQDEIDEWVIQGSLAAGRDLRPCYEFWGWELTDRVKTSVENLTPYFFKDVATDEWAPDRAAFILQRYPGVSRQIEKSTETFEETIPPPTIPKPQIRVEEQKNM